MHDMVLRQGVPLHKNIVGSRIVENQYLKDWWLHN